MNSAVLGDLIKAGILLALNKLGFVRFRLCYMFMRDVVIGLNLLLVLRLLAFSLCILFYSANSCGPRVSFSYYFDLNVAICILELSGLIKSVS